MRIFFISEELDSDLLIREDDELDFEEEEEDDELWTWSLEGIGSDIEDGLDMGWAICRFCERIEFRSLDISGLIIVKDSKTRFLEFSEESLDLTFLRT